MPPANIYELKDCAVCLGNLDYKTALDRSISTLIKQRR